MRTKGHENKHNLEEDVVLYTFESFAMCLHQVFQVVPSGLDAQSDLS
jgi:hypothetical protein